MAQRRCPATATAALGLATLLLLVGAAAAQGSDPFAPAGDLGQDPFAPTADAEQPSTDAGASPQRGGFGLAPGIGAPAAERLQMTGIATVAYSDEPISPFGAASLGCGLGFVAPTFQSNYVGVSPDVYADGMACDRCLRIQARCDDVSCADPGTKQLPALVADICGSCTRSDLSMSSPLFGNLTGRAPGSNPSIMVSWEVVPCAGLKPGTIKLLKKEGGSAFFQAFNLANSLQPITAVQINGQRLQHSSDNFWAWNPGQPIDPTKPLDVALLGANREARSAALGWVLRARVPSLRSADLAVQFKAS